MEYKIDEELNEKENFDSNDNRYSVSKDPNTFEGLFFYIFNKSNILLLLWFLAIYFIAYLALGFYFNKSEDASNYQLKLSRTVDIIALLSILMIVISTYASYSDKQKQSLVSTVGTETQSFITNPTSIFTMVIFFAFFYLIVYLFRLPMDRENKPITVSLIEGVAWILFAIILITDFFKYVLNVSFVDGVSKMVDWEKLPDYAPTPAPTPAPTTRKPRVVGNLNLSGPVQKDEVFNITNNLYTYDDAQAICSAYGAKIATYDQIEEAYNQGAEWCNYGWSAGQMAFFPTQKSTWQKLQNSDNNKNDCGRPGVNGGYFANPYIKFGVNCFGKKPAPTAAEMERMKEIKDKTYAKTPVQTLVDKKVQFWKENASKLLVLNSFNQNEWSEY
jgi:hypothetical protein